MKSFTSNQIMAKFAQIVMAALIGLVASGAAGDTCTSLDELNWLLGEWGFEGNGVRIEYSFHRDSDKQITRRIKASHLAKGTELAVDTANILLSDDGLILEEKDETGTKVTFKSALCGTSKLVLHGEKYGSPRKYIYEKVSNDLIRTGTQLGDRKPTMSTRTRIKAPVGESTTTSSISRAARTRPTD